MSHTTYGYTRDRLGFEPDREERRLQHYAGVTTYQNGKTYHKNGHSNGHHNEDILTGGVYEENLEKFRGVYRLRYCCCRRDIIKLSSL